MKHLKIENNKGYFLRNSSDWVEMNKMNKDDLLNLVNLAITEEAFEMDEYNDSLIQNPAHKTIYSHIYRQLLDIHARHEDFIEEQKNIYKEAFDKYCK
jgi:hypothetical protein